MGKTLMRLEAHGYVSGQRSQVVSITGAGTSARETASDLQRVVLAAAAVDTDTLRAELGTIVLALSAVEPNPAGN